MVWIVWKVSSTQRLHLPLVAKVFTELSNSVFICDGLWWVLLQPYRPLLLTQTGSIFTDLKFK